MNRIFDFQLKHSTANKFSFLFSETSVSALNLSWLKLVYLLKEYFQGLIYKINKQTKQASLLTFSA